MGQRLRGNTRWSFRAYMDVRSYAAHERLGNNIDVIGASIRANLEQARSAVGWPGGSVSRLEADVIRSNTTADVLSCVITWTPGGDVDTDDVGTQLIASANHGARGANVEGFGGHVTANGSAVWYWRSAFGSREAWLAGQGARVVYDVHAGDTSDQPNASGSLPGRLSSSLNQTVASTDPEREGRSRAELALPDAIQSFTGGMPWWVVPVAVGAAALGALFITGAALGKFGRGVSSARRAVK